MSRQSTDNLYIELGYYNPEEYYTYEASAESALASEFNLAATISHIEGVDIVATSFATVDVSGDRVRTADTTMSSEFGLSAQPSGTEEAAAAVTATASLDITISKISDVTVTLSSEFTQTAQADRFINIDATINSAVTQVTDIEVTRGFGVGLSSDADCSCVNYRVRDAASEVGALFNAAIQIVVTVNSFAILDSVSTVTADVDRVIGQNIISTTASVTLSAEAIKFKQAQATLNSTASISITANVPTQRPRPVFLNNVSSQSRTGIETSIKKFGTGSGYAVGSGYAEYTATNGDLTLGTGDFAIEIWMYPVVSRANDFAILSNPYALTINALVPKMLLGSVTLTSSTAATLNSWNHLVISKTGSRSSMFLNGTRVATSTTSFTASTSSTLRIRGYSKPAPLDDDPGIYYDDFSFHKGSDIGFNAANTTITIPTDARSNLPVGTDPNQTFTQLLVHFDGNFEDDVSITEQAQASITSTSSVSAAAAKTAGANSSLSSTVTISADATTLIDSAAALTSQGFVVAAVARKVDELADFTVTTSLTSNAGRLLSTSATANSNFTQSSVIGTVKQFASAITGAATFAVTVTEFEGVGQIPMSASFAVTAVANQRHSGRSTQTAVSTTVINASAFSRYWFNVLESDSAGDGVDSDPQGNIYSVGIYSLGPTEYDSDLIAVKYSKLGDITWQTRIQTPTALVRTNSETVVDSDGNVYITGSIEETFPTMAYVDLLVIKLNSSGVLQWSRFLRAGNGTNQNGYKLDLDSSNNVYVGGLGRIAVSGQPDTPVGLLAKYSSSGTLIWQKQISNIYSIYGIAVKDSNFYVTGETSGPNSRKVFVAKLDLDGSIVWQKSIGDIDIDSEWGTDIDVDSQGNVFISGFDIGSDKTIFLKFNNSGTIQFQQLISKTGSAQLFAPSLTINSSDNVLLSLQRSGDGYTSIATFNSSGNLIRARFVNVGFNDIDVDRYDDILLTGNNQLTTVKLPGDGSRTEFITEFDYVIENDLVIESASYTVADTSSTVSNSSWTTTPYTITQITNTDDSSLYIINQLISGSAVVTSQFSQSATFGKIRQFSSSVSSTVTQASTVRKIVNPTVSLTSNFSQSTQVRRIRTGSSNLSTAVTVTITGQRVRFADSQQSATASLTASGDRSRQTSLTVQSSTNLNETSQRIRYFDTDFESLATQLTAAGYNATGTVLLESRFESSVEAQKTTDVVSNLVIDTDFTVVNDRFRSVDSSITSETIVFAEALNIRPAGSSMEVTSSLSINTDTSRIVGITANSTSEFTQTTVNDTLRLAVASLSATATASIIAFKVKQFNIALTSQASIQTLTGIRADARADLPAISVQLTVGDVINIDPFYQIKVEQESRQGTVRPENRVIQVEQETRLNMII